MRRDENTQTHTVETERSRVHCCKDDNETPPFNTPYLSSVNISNNHSTCRCIAAYTRQIRPSTIIFLCGLLVGCLTSQQQASVSEGRICSDNFTCCHTDVEVADQIFYLAQSQYTDTWPTGSSTDPIIPGACQGSHWSANV